VGVPLELEPPKNTNHDDKGGRGRLRHDHIYITTIYPPYNLIMHSILQVIDNFWMERARKRETEDTTPIYSTLSKLSSSPRTMRLQHPCTVQRVKQWPHTRSTPLTLYYNSSVRLLGHYCYRYKTNYRNKVQCWEHVNNSNVVVLVNCCWNWADLCSQHFSPEYRLEVF